MDAWAEPKHDPVKTFEAPASHEFVKSPKRKNRANRALSSASADSAPLPQAQLNFQARPPRPSTALLPTTTAGNAGLVTAAPTRQQNTRTPSTAAPPRRQSKFQIENNRNKKTTHDVCTCSCLISVSLYVTLVLFEVSTLCVLILFLPCTALCKLHG